MELVCGQGGSNGSEIVGQINRNTNNIDDLKELSLYTVDYGGEVLNIPGTYVELNSIDKVLDVGQYLLTVAMQYQFDTVNKSVFIRSTINGVVTLFSIEPKDTTDVKFFVFPVPFRWNGGAFSARIEVRKEGTGGVLDVLKSNMWVEKKSNSIY